MTEQDNTDLEFRYAPNWGWVGIRVSALLILGVWAFIKMNSSYPNITFGETEISNGLSFAIQLAIILVAFLGGGLILYRSYRKLAHPQIVYVNSQRIKLPESLFKSTYKSINFRDIYNVVDRKNFYSRFLSISHKRGKLRIKGGRLENEQSYLDLRDLIEKFHRTHHTAAVMQEIEKERNKKSNKQSPGLTA